ncbi:MAG TPA: hypothetical protein VFV51_02510, partial [Vicinamibacterales bacterium]|nr:hypothetical protein [Vicinamibacterales bacterium]
MSARFLPSFVCAVLLAACGGGGDSGSGGDGTDGGGTAYVGIDTPYRADPADPTVELYGVASCDTCPPTATAFGYCPSIEPPRSSAIDVTWTNRATGASGATYHAIVGSCSCLLSQCIVAYSHRWSAVVPLALGDNPIEVRATRDGQSGQDTVTVRRLPPAAQELVAVAGSAQVTLSWSPVSDATSYNLYFADARGVTPATGTKVAGVSSPFVHAGLTDGVTHYYTLTTVAGGVESAGSPVAWATPGWRTQTIGATMPNTTYSWRDVSIAADSAGRAHVHHSWGDIGPGGTLRNDYLTNTGGTWESRNAALPVWVHAGLALGAADTVHVSYFTGSLRHSVLTGDAWVAETAATDGWCTASLALDGGDHAHIAYFASSPSPRLRHTTNASGAWVGTDIAAADAGCSVGEKVSLAIDGAGAAHVAFFGPAPAYGLQYATNRGGSWTSSVLEAGYMLSVAIAVDDNDKVHLVYSNNAGELKIASDATGAWSSEVLEDEGGPNHASLALDPAGKAHVSYTDGRYGGELRYLTNASGSWRMALVDAADYDNGGGLTDT